MRGIAGNRTSNPQRVQVQVINTAHLCRFTPTEGSLRVAKHHVSGIQLGTITSTLRAKGVAHHSRAGIAFEPAVRTVVAGPVPIERPVATGLEGRQGTVAGVRKIIAGWGDPAAGIAVGICGISNRMVVVVESRPKLTNQIDVVSGASVMFVGQYAFTGSQYVF